MNIVRDIYKRFESYSNHEGLIYYIKEKSFTEVGDYGAAERMSVVNHETCGAYEGACIEARRWIEVSDNVCLTNSTFC